MNALAEPPSPHPPSTSPNSARVAQWAGLNVGDRLRVLNSTGIEFEGHIDARSSDGSTIWITGGSILTRRLFHISDDIWLQRLTPPQDKP